MGLKDALTRLRQAFSQGNPGKPVSPDEKELEVYVERERKQKVRQALDHYRRKERREFLQDNPLNPTFKQSPIIETKRRTGQLSMKQKKSLRKHDRVLGGPNFFMR